METPKPKPPVQKQTESKKDPKKPFVRPEHLTSKPFRDNEALRKLQSELNKRERRRPINPKSKRQR